MVFEIDFTTPFSYDPTIGNLLLEIINEDITSIGTGLLDARNDASALGINESHAHLWHWLRRIGVGDGVFDR